MKIVGIYACLDTVECARIYRLLCDEIHIIEAQNKQRTSWGQDSIVV